MVDNDILLGIAQELGNLNTTLARIAVALEARNAPAPYVGPTGPYGTAEDCTARACSYFTGYLTYGPPDLEHEAFHVVEQRAGDHIRQCRRMETKGVCPTCTDFEQRIRA